MERECLHNLLWEHRSSMSHWSCTSPFQSWTTTTMPSVITNDNFCSRSIALLIVNRLHIFQWHQITASLLCMVSHVEKHTRGVPVLAMAVFLSVGSRHLVFNWGLLGNPGWLVLSEIRG
jgi:hypothetical protein